MSEFASAMANAASAVVSAGMSPSGRLNMCRHLQENEIEELLSDRLVDGCVLMDRSCPACVTPLLKQVDELVPYPGDDASLKRGKSRDTTKSNQSLTPIEGVPFCVACQAHVVTSSDEIDKVEEQKQSLKDLVLTALALEDEPMFVCHGNPYGQAILQQIEEEQGYEVIRPEQWREDPSVRSRLSKKSASGSKKSSKSAGSLTSTLSQKNRMKRLAFEFADDGDVEIVRAQSSFAVTPKESLSQTSRKTNRSFKMEQISIKEEVEEKREDENATENPRSEKQEVAEKDENVHEHDDECHEKEITITPDLVDKTPGSGTRGSPASSIAEIDVKRECSVDAEELTADFLTFAESEDEWLSYEEK